MNDAEEERGQGHQDRRLDALGNFQEAAEAAIPAWGQDLTTGQGMSAAWMLRNVINDFRIAAGLLSGSQGTGSSAVPNAPGERIAMAAESWTAPVSSARTRLSGDCGGYRSQPGARCRSRGRPLEDGPAVAAAHAMHNAMSVSSGIWRQPADNTEIRDEIVTQMMVAVKC